MEPALRSMHNNATPKAVSIKTLSASRLAYCAWALAAQCLSDRPSSWKHEIPNRSRGENGLGSNFQRTNQSVNVPDLQIQNVSAGKSVTTFWEITGEFYSICFKRNSVAKTIRFKNIALLTSEFKLALND